MVLDEDTVESYLRRIGAKRPAHPDAGALRVLQERHVMSVPFENVDCYVRRPLGLGEAAVRKVAERHRGGGCYELNSALGLLLRALGYPVTVLGARVYHGDVLMPPLRHLVLLVETPETWLVDVGFGFGKDRNSRFPLRFGDRSPQQDPHGEYLLVDAPHGDVDVVRDGTPLYRLERHPRDIGEFEATLWWFHTAPESPMLQALFCVRQTETGRVSLKNRTLVRTAGAERTTVTLESREQVREVLAAEFGIEVPGLPDFERPPGELARIIAAEIAAAAAPRGERA
ncbi:arylamine N-acetyltransferase [Amycolatopsis sp. NPDC059021]|uniref:arylamine N-acetyltransferase family protein n=1 Tax=Amycolatopsis sp. NPDC059021 TaxID=3346704 RepID=UPI00366AD44B